MEAGPDEVRPGLDVDGGRPAASGSGIAVERAAAEAVRGRESGQPEIGDAPVQTVTMVVPPVPLPPRIVPPPAHGVGQGIEVTAKLNVAAVHREGGGAAGSITAG